MAFEYSRSILGHPGNGNLVEKFEFEFIILFLGP
jgi:hypothetical protein